MQLESENERARGKRKRSHDPVTVVFLFSIFFLVFGFPRNCLVNNFYFCLILCEEGASFYLWTWIFENSTDGLQGETFTASIRILISINWGFGFGWRGPLIPCTSTRLETKSVIFVWIPHGNWFWILEPSVAFLRRVQVSDHEKATRRSVCSLYSL